MRTFWVMLGRALLVGLAALGLFVVWFCYTVSWSGPARRAARNRTNSYQLRLGMRAAEVRKLLGHADQQMPADFAAPNTVWSYATPFMSDGTLMVYLAQDSTVTNIIYPKGEAPPVLSKK